MRRLHVRVNFLWALSGNLAFAGAQWAFIVILARLGDAPMVGQYSLGLAVVAPLFLLASLNLRALQVTDVREDFDFLDYFTIRMMTSAVAFVVCTAVALSGNYSRQTAAVIAGLTASKAIEATSEVIQGRLHQYERMDVVAQSLMLRWLGSLVVMTAIVFYLKSAVWAVLGACVWSFSVLVIFDIPALGRSGVWRGKLWDSFHRIRESVSRSKVLRQSREILVEAGPLGFILMLVSLNGSLCRFWLAHFHGEREVGLFSALSYVALAANTLVIAMGQASGPAMARCSVNGDANGYMRRAGKLAVLGGIISAGGIGFALFWGREALGLLYGPKFATQTEAFQWLMVGSAFSVLATCAGYSLSSARYIKEQVPMHLAVGATICAAAWWLIPRYGVLGAAYAQAGGYFLQLLVSVAMVDKVYRRIAGTQTGEQTKTQMNPALGEMRIRRHGNPYSYTIGSRALLSGLLALRERRWIPRSGRNPV
ncbi:MAG: oligosaccharide flippase family protein [Acidobacteria bacterium]|nr:oligosaccharide flippase family protein [Acidobacteriota bacterium]